MKTASKEIRAIVIHAHFEKNMTPKQLADIFGYSHASICNWIRVYKNENRLYAKPTGHRKSCFSDEEKDQLYKLLKNKVDMTLSEIREYFNKTCSLTAIHNTVKKLGFVLKKNSKGQRTKS